LIRSGSTFNPMANRGRMNVACALDLILLLIA
jgi:hypothetical protein